jgi:flagellar biogenesis protein FliO
MQAVTFFFAFVAVLALIGLAAWLVRRFAGNRLGANTNRGRWMDVGDWCWFAATTSNIC